MCKQQDWVVNKCAGEEGILRLCADTVCRVLYPMCSVVWGISTLIHTDASEEVYISTEGQVVWVKTN